MAGDGPLPFRRLAVHPDAALAEQLREVCAEAVARPGQDVAHRLARCARFADSGGAAAGPNSRSLAISRRSSTSSGSA